jgi:hypothetical protein
MGADEEIGAACVRPIAKTRAAPKRIFFIFLIFIAAKLDGPY